MITSRQIRAGRAMLGLGQRELGEIAGISPATIHRIEGQDGEPNGLAINVRNIIRALEERGIVFIEDGVVMRHPVEKVAE